jgi:hypothetical protein
MGASAVAAGAEGDVEPVPGAAATGGGEGGDDAGAPTAATPR